MNVTPRREGFVENDPAVKHEINQEPAQPAGKHPRAVPPPELEQSPADLPPLLQDKWPVVVQLLYKPIRDNFGKQVKEVTLREPRAGDINRYGNPVRVNQDGDVIIDERKMTYIIAALSDILPPFIEDMDPRDWNSCAYRLRRFFLPDPAAW